jgi:hypothetical protein
MTKVDATARPDGDRPSRNPHLRAFGQETVFNLEMLSQEVDRILARAKELLAELEAQDD